MTVALTTTAAFFETAFEVLVTRVHAVQARRAQRIALASLMDMDAHRLDDLGISATDVADALAGPLPVARHLEIRRAARASSPTIRTGAAVAA